MLCAQLYLTFCNPMDCSLPSFSVHEIFQERILEWVAISYSRESSWPRDETHISCIGRHILYHYATWEAIVLHYLSYCSNCSQVLVSWLSQLTPESFDMPHHLLLLCFIHSFSLFEYFITFWPDSPSLPCTFTGIVQEAAIS